MRKLNLEFLVDDAHKVLSSKRRLAPRMRRLNTIAGAITNFRPRDAKSNSYVLDELAVRLYDRIDKRNEQEVKNLLSSINSIRSYAKGPKAQEAYSALTNKRMLYKDRFDNIRNIISSQDVGYDDLLRCASYLNNNRYLRRKSLSNEDFNRQRKELLAMINKRIKKMRPLRVAHYAKKAYLYGSLAAGIALMGASMIL